MTPEELKAATERARQMRPAMLAMTTEDMPSAIRETALLLTRQADEFLALVAENERLHDVVVILGQRMDKAEALVGDLVKATLDLLNAVTFGPRSFLSPNNPGYEAKVPIGFVEDVKAALAKVRDPHRCGKQPGECESTCDPEPEAREAQGEQHPAADDMGHVRSVYDLNEEVKDAD